MKHLVIVGAGGFGREMYGAALESVGYGAAFDVKGFLDDRSDALAAFAGYPPVIGSPDGYEIAADSRRAAGARRRSRRAARSSFP